MLCPGFVDTASACSALVIRNICGATLSDLSPARWCPSLLSSASCRMDALLARVQPFVGVVVTGTVSGVRCPLSSGQSGDGDSHFESPGAVPRGRDRRVDTYRKDNFSLVVQGEAHAAGNAELLQAPRCPTEAYLGVCPGQCPNRVRECECLAMRGFFRALSNNCDVGQRTLEAEDARVKGLGRATTLRTREL